MPLWDLNNPPKYATKVNQDVVATEKGWKDSRTQEILVAIGKLATRAGEANILSVKFDKSEYLREDSVSVVVEYNELVDVSDGAELVLSWSGLAGDFSVFAVEQLQTQSVLFNLAVDLVSPVLVPDEAGILSLTAQTIVGTIVDSADAGSVASEKDISAEVALAAGSFEVI